MAVTSTLFEEKIGQVVQFPSNPEEKTYKTNRRYTPIDQHMKKEVYALEIKEIKAILNYFAEKKLWMQYMVFTIACNTGRRAGDILSMKWCDFFNPKTGKFLTDADIREEKTGKYANIYLNAAVKSAIELYIEKTHCDPAKNDYKNAISLQLIGTHRGKQLSYNGYRAAIKKAAAACGVDKNVGTHSARKSFGKLTMELHPNDVEYLAILSDMFNHSNERITRKYIGLTKEKKNGCYDDIGKVFEDHVFGDSEYKMLSGKPVVSIKSTDLRALIQEAYEAGLRNAGTEDISIHLNAVNELVESAENLI